MTNIIRFNPVPVGRNATCHCYRNTIPVPCFVAFKCCTISLTSLKHPNLGITTTSRARAQEIYCRIIDHTPITQQWIRNQTSMTILCWLVPFMYGCAKEELCDKIGFLTHHFPSEEWAKVEQCQASAVLTQHHSLFSTFTHFVLLVNFSFALDKPIFFSDLWIQEPCCHTAFLFLISLLDYYCCIVLIDTISLSTSLAMMFIWFVTSGHEENTIETTSRASIADYYLKN